MNDSGRSLPAKQQPLSPGIQAGALTVREILFATDFSPASHVASLYARALAMELAIPLTIVHVFLSRPSAQAAEALTDRASEQRTDITKQLKEAAEALSESEQDVGTVLCEGEPAEELQRLVAGRPGVLLVLGTNGGSSLERHLLGSTAERVLTVVSCPTLTVGPNVTNPEQGRLFQHVLYATDCSRTGAQTSPLACALASRLSGRLKVISVINENGHSGEDVLAEFDFTAEREMEDTLQHSCGDFTESREIASSKDAREFILNSLLENHSDLLVLGIRQHDFLGFAERNSIAFQIISEASKPVLTITDRAFS